MAWQDSLIVARDQIAARIVDITTYPKPDYSINGKSVSWSAYLGQLTDALTSLNEAIAAGEIYEEHTSVL